jgi:hypothetical protein
MAFISLQDFLSIWHFKLVGQIGQRAVSERVNLILDMISYKMDRSPPT